LRRLRITERQVDLVQSFTSGIFTKTGKLSTGETLDPLDTTGLIRLKRVVPRYEDQVRSADVFYYPETQEDALRLYMFLTIATNAPLSAEIFGRGSRQNFLFYDLFNSIITGEDFPTPVGLSPFETFLSIFSLQTKAIMSDDTTKARELRGMTQEVREKSRELDDKQ